MQGVKTPCAFNNTGFSNFFESLKNRTAGRKYFFDTLKPPVKPEAFSLHKYRKQLSYADAQIISDGVAQDTAEDAGEDDLLVF